MGTKMPELPRDIWLNVMSMVLNSKNSTLADLAKCMAFPSTRNLFYLKSVEIEGTPNPETVMIGLNGQALLEVHHTRIFDAYQILETFLPTTATLKISNFKKEVHWASLLYWICDMELINQVTISDSQLTEAITAPISQCNATAVNFVRCSSKDDFFDQMFWNPPRMAITDCDPETMCHLVERTVIYGGQMSDLTLKISKERLTIQEFLLSLKRDAAATRVNRLYWERLFDLLSERSDIALVLQFDQAAEDQIIIAELLVRSGMLTLCEYFDLFTKLLDDCRLVFGVTYGRLNNVHRLFLQEEFAAVLAARQKHRLGLSLSPLMGPWNSSNSDSGFDSCSDSVPSSPSSSDTGIQM
ncbi:unnamed protein product, partial [Mesorhabditis spiculigera]